jgi:hypothetical protein
MSSLGLEARYRKLLAWFPAEHRAAHGEEMLGVLMAGADPQRRRPGAAESADLFLGAARIRLRPGRALTDRDGWRDALAIFSVAAPVLVFASMVIAYLAVDLWALGIGVPGAVLAEMAGNPVLGLLIFGQVLVVPLVLLGLRRWAVVPALIQVVVIGYLVVRASRYGTDALYVLAASYQVVPIAEIVALLASPGPRRGRQLLRRRHWALLALVAVPAAAIVLPFSYAEELITVGLAQARLTAGGLELYATPDARVIQLTAAVLIAVALLAAWLSSANGKRLAVLFLVIACPYVLVAMLRSTTGSVAIPSSVFVVVVACMVVAIVVRTWRRSRAPAGRGPGGETT